MKCIRWYRQNQLFWMEFIIMLGVLLGVVTMTLAMAGKIHRLSEANRMQLEASITMQNLIEYCKVNAETLDISLENLGAMPLEEVKEQSKWKIYYDQSWNITTAAQKAEFIIEISAKKTDYTHGTFINLEIASYSSKQKPILTLVGSAIIRDKEQTEDESAI